MEKKDYRKIKQTFAALLLFICILFCYGCANYDQQALNIAKQLICGDLKNPSSAVWNDVHIEMKDEYNRYVVYVDVSAQNGFGGYNRNEYYVGFRIDNDGETFYYKRYLYYVTANGFLTAENARNMFFDDWGQPVTKEGYSGNTQTPDNSTNNENETDNNQNNSGQQDTTQTSYSIQYFVNDNSFGSVTGELNQTVQKNSNGSSVTAVAKEGYRFVGWSDGVTTATRQEKNVTKNISVIASFEVIPTYTIEYRTGKNGSINGEINQLVKEGENSSSVTAVPDEGYRFVGWSDGITTATRQDFNVVSDVNVSATFELIEYTYTYKVQVSGGTSMGTLNGDRETVVEMKGSILNDYQGELVTAYPSQEYYRFIGWSDGETEITRQDKIENNKEVIAQFELFYKFTFVAGEGGTIQGETYQEVGDGEKTTAVTAVANEGYEFWGWQYQQYHSDYYLWSETIIVSSNDWTFGDTYTAIFKKIEYTAKYTSTYGGAIKYEYTPFDQNANNYNSNGVSSVTFTISIDNQFNAPQVTATPDENYRFVKWSDGNTSPTRQDLNLNGNLEVKAEFVRVYKFIFVAGEGGTIQGETYQEVGDGEKTTAVTAVANEGYEFWGWHYQQYQGDYYLWSETISVSSNDWTFSDTYTAIFKKIQYTAKYTSTYGGAIKYEYTPFDKNANNYNSNGVSSVTFTISVDNQFNAPQVTATADENYRFVKWSDGNTSPTRQDLNLNGNLEVEAEFVRVYKFIFVAGEGGTIQGETYQEVDKGNYTTAVTAVANEGYEFWGWHYQQYQGDYYLRSETISVSSNDWTFGDYYTAIFKKV